MNAREQFLSDVITCAIEGGIDYWSLCSHYQWVGDDDEINVYVGARAGEDRNDTYAIVHETDGEDGYQDAPLLIDGAVIRQGITRLINGEASYPEWAQRRMAQINRANDGCEIDADDADHIVQAGLFGEIRYA